MVAIVGVRTQGFLQRAWFQRSRRSESTAHLASQLHQEAKKQGETEAQKRQCDLRLLGQATSAGTACLPPLA